MYLYPWSYKHICTSGTWMWFCNIFWRKWVMQVIPEKQMFHWWTVSLCQFEANNVTSTYLFEIQQNLVLFFLKWVYCLLVVCLTDYLWQNVKISFELELKETLKCHKWESQFFYSFFWYISVSNRELMVCPFSKGSTTLELDSNMPPF